MKQLPFIVVIVLVLLLLALIKDKFNTTLYADDIGTSSAVLVNIAIATPSADITDTASGSASVQENTMSEDTITSTATPSAQPTMATSMSTTNTGDSIASTSITNMVNTQLINSHIYYQTINIFLDTHASIDLSHPIAAAESVAATTTDPTTNILVTSTTNYSVLNNATTTVANTGDNTSSGNTVIINTGNAYASTQLINYLNVTLVDTDIHIVTINIYGNMFGNIIFPNVPSIDLSTCSNQTASTSAAMVTNAITNTANAGNNTLVASQSGEIITGNATSITSVTNFINAISSGDTFQTITTHTFGTWSGDFLGLGTNTKQTGLSQINLPLLIATDAAKITNIVTNTANTGNNAAAGNTNEIITGNAYANVNILNIINAIFTKSFGYFAFINIFGNITGNIGDAVYFVTPTPTINMASNTIVEPTSIQENVVLPTPTITSANDIIQSSKKSDPIKNPIVSQKRSVLAVATKTSPKNGSNFSKIVILLLFIAIGGFCFQRLFH